MKTKQILLLLFLFLSGLLLTYKYLYETDGSMTVINYPHSTKNISPSKPVQLLKDQKITGTFNSVSDNLGGLSFRFDNHDDISTDSVSFRIKETDQTNWLFRSTYNVDQFQSEELFPFGFEIQKQSQDKNYYFEIESQSGSTDSAIWIASEKPLFTSKYQFSVGQLKSPQKLMFFVGLKAISLFKNPRFLIYLFLYLNPFLIMTLYFFASKKTKVFAFLPIITLLFYVFTKDRGYFLVPQILILDWVLAIILYRLNSKQSIVPALLFIILISIQIFIGDEKNANNAAIWVYVLIIISSILLIIEATFKKQHHE